MLNQFGVGDRDRFSEKGEIEFHSFRWVCLGKPVYTQIKITEEAEDIGSEMHLKMLKLAEKRR